MKVGIEKQNNGVFLCETSCFCFVYLCVIAITQKTQSVDTKDTK